MINMCPLCTVIYSISMDTSLKLHWPLIFYSPLPVILCSLCPCLPFSPPLLLCVSLTLLMLVCQSLFGSPHSRLHCIFISELPLSLHSLQPNKVWIQGEQEGTEGERKMVGKGWTIGIRRIFPQKWFWSVHTCVFLLACVFLCKERPHR